MAFKIEVVFSDEEIDDFIDTYNAESALPITLEDFENHIDDIKHILSMFAYDCISEIFTDSEYGDAYEIFGDVFESDEDFEDSEDFEEPTVSQRLN